MYYLIYKITNLINGKIYVGSHKTTNINDSYMGSGKYLLHAQHKYGIEFFKKDILYVFDNPDDMYQKEAEIVNENFLMEENTYNLKKGGMGGFDFINQARKNLYGKNGQSGFGGENLKISLTRDRMVSQGRYDEWKTKISSSLKGKQSPFKGRKHSEETIGILRGHERQQGEKNSQFGTCWVCKPDHGNKKVKKEDLESYLSAGWIKGRKARGLPQYG